jgi:hypothetical protein
LGDQPAKQEKLNSSDYSRFLSKNPAKDFCSGDLDGVVVVVVRRAVVNFSLDLAA